MVALVALAGPAAAQGDAGAGAAGDAGAAPPDARGPLTIPAPTPDAPEIRAVASTDTVAIGEPFSLLVTVTHPRGMQVNLPASLGFGEVFEEIRRENVARQLPGGRMVREFELAVMAWDVGDLEIPPVPVTYAHQGRVATVFGNSVPIRVISVIGDGEESLRDIAPPVPVYERDWTRVYIAAVILTALVVAILFLVVRRRLRRRGPVRYRTAAAAAALLDPDEEALARLTALEQSGALDADDRQPVYVELSEIVRRYLGRRYGFSALDLTSSELLVRLREQPAAGPAVAPVAELFERFDLVKYARGSAGRERAHADLELVRQLVVTTRPAPATSEAPRA
jgi:hypothetical protein